MWRIFSYNKEAILLTVVFTTVCECSSSSNSSSSNSSSSCPPPEYYLCSYGNFLSEDDCLSSVADTFHDGSCNRDHTFPGKDGRYLCPWLSHRGCWPQEESKMDKAGGERNSTKKLFYIYINLTHVNWQTTVICKKVLLKHVIL